MADDPKLLRRQHYARGRRKGTKGLKTGESVSRRQTWRERDAAELRYTTLQPKYYPCDPDPDDEVKLGVHVVQRHFRLRTPMNGQTVLDDPPLTGPLSFRKAGGSPFREWFVAGDALDPLTCASLDEALEAGLEEVCIDVDYGRQLWLRQPHNWKRIRPGVERYREEAALLKSRGRGRGRRRRASASASASPSTRGRVATPGKQIVRGGWQWAAAVSHRRRSDRRSARMAPMGGGAPRRLPSPPPPPQRPLAVVAVEEEPPAVIVLRRGASLIEEEIREHRYLPPRLWLRVLQMVGSLSLGLVMSRNIGDAVRDHVTALRVQAPRAWPRVVDLDRWPRVRSLTLVNAQFGGVQGLCRSVDPAFLARLRRLVLDYCGIEDDGAHELAAALAAGRFPALRVLQLRSNRLSLDAVRAVVNALVDSAATPKLRVLDLSDLMWAFDAPCVVLDLCRGVLQGALPRLRFARLDPLGLGCVFHDDPRLVDALRGVDVEFSMTGVNVPR